jgi:hypothetical protein
MPGQRAQAVLQGQTGSCSPTPAPASRSKPPPVGCVGLQIQYSWANPQFSTLVAPAYLIGRRKDAPGWRVVLEKCIPLLLPVLGSSAKISTSDSILLFLIASKYAQVPGC